MCVCERAFIQKFAGIYIYIKSCISFRNQYCIHSNISLNTIYKFVLKFVSEI